MIPNLQIPKSIVRKTLDTELQVSKQVSKLLLKLKKTIQGIISYDTVSKKKPMSKGIMNVHKTRKYKYARMKLKKRREDAHRAASLKEKYNVKFGIILLLIYRNLRKYLRFTGKLMGIGICNTL